MNSILQLFWKLLALITQETQIFLEFIKSHKHHWKAHEKARIVLEQVGLGSREKHKPDELSGGEQQRVAIARAIAKRPQVLLCDEPTGALDFQTGKLVLQVLERVNQELGTTTAVITHNAGIAAMADRVITMRSGEIIRIQCNETKVAPEALEW